MGKSDMLNKICLHKISFFAFALAMEFTTGERSCVMYPEKMQAHFRKVLIVKSLKPIEDINM
jgi:hypothetical protein